MQRLFFANGNQKLRRGEIVFSLPAGHSCPFAYACQSFADRETGKITDGKHTEHRCYAASLEIRPNVRKAHWRNFDTLRQVKTASGLTDLLVKELPMGEVYRIHSSGDFYSQAYFDAWLNVAKLYPHKIFYAYTKALPFWIARESEIPSNFKLTASYGGTFDHLIEKHDLKYCRVVKTKAEARKLGLPIDHDDSHAWEQDKPFALLVHGTQPKGTLWAKAWYKIRAFNMKKRGAND